jgi:hypothetical protein
MDTARLRLINKTLRDLLVHRKVFIVEEDRVKEKVVKSVEYDSDGITYFLSDFVGEFPDMSVDKIYMTYLEAVCALDQQIKSLD